MHKYHRQVQTRGLITLTVIAEAREIFKTQGENAAVRHLIGFGCPMGRAQMCIRDINTALKMEARKSFQKLEEAYRMKTLVSGIQAGMIDGKTPFFLQNQAA